MSDNISVMKGLMSYKNLVHAIAGATGSVVAITAFYPLDTARTRLQVDDNLKAEYSYVVVKDILEKEGLAFLHLISRRIKQQNIHSSLYRGLLPVVISVCCSNFVYFYIFNGLKLYAYSGGAKPYPSKDLLLAFIAGIANVVITTPLWVANTRLKLQGVKWATEKARGSNGSNGSNGSGHRDDRPVRNYNGMIDALKGIAREEGLGSLWSSTLPSMLLASNPAVHFMVYESLKRNVQESLGKKELSGFVYFVMGAIAKMVATFVTYPVQVVQSKQRSSQGRDATMMQCIQNILRTSGWQGLFKGLETKLTLTVAMAALMFLTYEKIAGTVFRLMRQQYIQSKAH